MKAQPSKNIRARGNIILKPLILLCLLLLLQFNPIAAGMDFDTDCIQPLIQANNSTTTPRNTRLTRDEYIEFIRVKTNSILDYTALPIEFLIQFNTLLCLNCKPIFTEYTCCTDEPDHPDGPSLNLQGLYDDDRSSQERLYLFQICDVTEDMIEEVLRTDAPTPVPTPVPGEDVDLETPFVLGNGEGLTAEDFREDKGGVMTELEEAFEDVVIEIIDEINLNGTLGGRRVRGLEGSDSGSGSILEERRHGGRKLVTLHYMDSSIPAVEDVACPANLPNATSSSCQTMQGEVSIRVEDIPAATAKEEIEKSIKDAMANGALNKHLSDAIYLTPDPRVSIDPPTPAPVQTAGPAQSPTPRGVALEPTGLGTGAIAGIASGAVALGLFAAAALFVNRRRNEERRNAIESTFATTNPANSNVLGASSPYSGKHKIPVGDFSSLSDGDEEDGSLQLNSDLDLGRGKSGITRETIGDPLPQLESSQEDSLESSSNAGSSGWSSSAGMSSLNTGSVDSMADEFGYGPSLATIGVVSGMHNRYQKEEAGRGNNTEPEIYAVGGDGSSVEDESSSELDDDDGEPNMQHLSRVDLNSAIEAGDWAAVGATATLLAQADSSRSGSGSVASSNLSITSAGSGMSSSGLSMSANSLDQVRAAELDDLVEAGDWEGVVLAAQKYEAESDADCDSSYVSANTANTGYKSGTTGSYASALTNRSGTDRSLGSYSETPSASTATGISESPSKIQKRAEIRAEVEKLVKRVVPDEIDNVDEMMVQFYGREEELVETLRTMQERSIAQREREAVRRNAKREARKNVRSKAGLPPVIPKPPVSGNKNNAGVGAAAGAAAIGVAAVAMAPVASNSDSEDNVKSSSVSDISDPIQGIAAANIDVTSSSSNNEMDRGTKSDSSKSFNSPSRSALERAIQVGDWDAVGLAAARMGEESVSSASEFTFDDSTFESSDRQSLTTTSKVSSGSNTAYSQRATELEKLIEKGDWSGVVAAASRYSSADKQTTDGTIPENDSLVKEPAVAASELDEWKDASSDKKKASDVGKVGKTSQEEEDALAQADIWMAIAQQSKNENTTAAKGASDAADWAISRSLKDLNSAEEIEEFAKKETQYDSENASNSGSSHCDKSV